MTVVVRRVRLRDGADLKAVRLNALLDAPSAFGSTYAAEAQLSDDDWNRRAELSAAGDHSVTFLARSDGRPVGIVRAYRPDESPAGVELASMWTAPEIRRSGVARSLVGAVVEWSSNAVTESISLWVVEFNLPARALYESIGFRSTGELKSLPSDPGRVEIRMRLEVGVGVEKSS